VRSCEPHLLYFLGKLLINKALSEYAPGRLIVINKKTYHSGGLASSKPIQDRAEPLFRRLKPYIFCP
jgi:hypothetical protein